MRNLNHADFKCSVSNHAQRNIILWCYTTNIVSYYLLKKNYGSMDDKNHTYLEKLILFFIFTSGFIWHSNVFLGILFHEKNDWATKVV